jgi:hypothetical protein
MKRGLQGLGILLGLLMLLVCFGPGRGAVDGRIVDAAHASRPVPGAYVVLKRERGGFGDWCDAEVMTYSDRHGQFHFGSWLPRIRSIWDVIFPTHYFLRLTVYKPGFAGGEDVSINDDYHGVIALQGGPLAPEEELQHIRYVGQGLHACDNSYEFDESVAPLVAALRQEAGRVPATPRQLFDATRILMSPAEVITMSRELSPAPLIGGQDRHAPTSPAPQAVPR